MPEIGRRRATSEDADFLYDVLKRALGPHVEATFGEWDDEWQRQEFERRSDAAAHEILIAEDLPIGCLKLREHPNHWSVDRIFLLPEWQNRGLGADVMTEVIESAGRAGKPIKLRVFRVSPARRFYERLGFSVVGETETHYLMERPL